MNLMKSPGTNQRASQFGLNQDDFLSSPFAVLYFCFSRRNSYPKLYKSTMRVFSTPDSSASCERVFSTMKKLFIQDRSTPSLDHISKIILSRSLRHYWREKTKHLSSLACLNAACLDILTLMRTGLVTNQNASESNQILRFDISIHRHGLYNIYEVQIISLALL